jgi:hypothetical protein
MVLQGACLFWPNEGTDIYLVPLCEFLGRSWTFRDFVITICVSSGMQYNINNLYNGYASAKDKTYALQIIAPYV